MSKKDKSKIDLYSDYYQLKKCLETFIEKNKDKDEETVYTASDFLNWLQRKVQIITNEKDFTIPEGIELKRTKVFWIDFGFNIGQEFGGKHPAIILRVSGEKVFALPLSSQAPDEDKKVLPMFVKIPIVYDLAPMTRWANVLNITCVSIQRIDLSSPSGRVPGKIMDKISEALTKCGLR
jgi:mRNA-degrading endonuclease toxin of MazEF toxin-antitoxin module